VSGTGRGFGSAPLKKHKRWRSFEVKTTKASYMVTRILFGIFILASLKTYSQQILEQDKYIVTIPDKVKGTIETLSFYDPTKGHMREDKYVLIQKYFSKDEYMYVDIYSKGSGESYHFRYDKNEYLRKRNLTFNRPLKQDSLSSVRVEDRMWTLATRPAEFLSSNLNDRKEGDGKVFYKTTAEWKYNDKLSICISIFETTRDQKHFEFLKSLMKNISVKQK
jgi:hypothetical protein